MPIIKVPQGWVIVGEDKIYPSREEARKHFNPHKSIRKKPKKR